MNARKACGCSKIEDNKNGPTEVVEHLNRAYPLTAYTERGWT